MTDPTFTRRRPRPFDGSSTTEQSIFTATEELLAENRMQELTVERMITAAGISRASFYHYFADKFDVLVAMLGRVLDEFYAQDAPWTSEPGRARARSLGTSLERTLDMWSDHGAVVCAGIEHMHTHAAVGAAWEKMFTRFVDAVAEQIEFERREGRGRNGAPAALVAALLVGAAERTFYVSARGLDPRLPTVADVIAPLRTITETTIYGAPPESTTGSRESTPTSPPVTIAEPVIKGRTAQAILDAMRDLLLEYSLAELSVAMVLRRSGVSRASYYFYFRNIESAFVALFRTAARDLVDGIPSMVNGTGEGSGSTSDRVRQWLDLETSAAPVIRNAVHAWPRLVELRAAYLEAMDAMETTVASIIESRRASGFLVEGPPTTQYAAASLWAIERAVAGALAGESHFDDLGAVTELVGDFMSEVVLGTDPTALDR